MAILLSLLSFGPAVYVWTQPTWEQMGWLLLIGLFGTSAQIAFAQALKDAETTVVMPFDFLKLVWVSLLGIWIFAELPDALTWLGAIIVFGSSFYIAWREHQAGRGRVSGA
jgi:drug/metabolite transporter (DMT)-like permease